MSEKSLKQADLARAAGVTDTAVYLWFRDCREPDIRSLACICETLGISADYLLFGSEPKYTNDNSNKD